MGGCSLWFSPALCFTGHRGLFSLCVVQAVSWCCHVGETAESSETKRWENSVLWGSSILILNELKCFLGRCTHLSVDRSQDGITFFLQYAFSCSMHAFPSSHCQKPGFLLILCWGCCWMWHIEECNGCPDLGGAQGHGWCPDLVGRNQPVAKGLEGDGL